MSGWTHKADASFIENETVRISSSLHCSYDPIMSKLGLLVTFVLTATALSVFLWFSQPSLNPTERALFSRIDQIVVKDPQASDIARTFSLPANCGKTGCFFKTSEADSLRYSGGKLHPGQKGLVFELKDLGTHCVRMDRIQRNFGHGTVEDSCPHGSCWYFTIQKEWGIFAFGLEKPSARCASTFVINSLPYQRMPPNSKLAAR